MLIKNLKINNLRNIESVDIDPVPQLNFLIGDNGAGKTSVLESLVVLAKGRSFRSGLPASLIGPVKDSYTVVTKVASGAGDQLTLGIERGRDDWRARCNGEDVAQLSDLAIHLPLVIMEPNSHLLITGSPEGRRRFLDWCVFHVEPKHLLNWRRYSRALRQRNAALKSRQVDVIRSLDEQVVPLGESIHQQRHQLFADINTTSRELIQVLCPELEEVELGYQSGWTGDSLREALNQSLERDLERGQTGPGPHRADISISACGKPARDRMSRGEQKVFSAALILSQARMITQGGEQPLLLLDDLASEFDETHLGNVMSFGADMGAQIWITGTSLAPYQPMTREEQAVFHVEHGKISEKTTA